VSEDEYERIARALLAAAREPSNAASAADVVRDLAAARRYDLQAVQATVVSLIDRGRIEITPDLRLSIPSKA
jgi:DNA-binding MarR family transcriptional regulator